jgi:hypothetical protein
MPKSGGTVRGERIERAIRWHERLKKQGDVTPRRQGGAKANVKTISPLANMIWRFREVLKKAEAIDVLFCCFDEALRASGYLAMGGQIVDATIVVAPKQRSAEDEKKAIKKGCISLNAASYRASIARNPRAGHCRNA